jgi:hypothetical protein
LNIYLTICSHIFTIDFDGQFHIIFFAVKNILVIYYSIIFCFTD